MSQVLDLATIISFAVGTVLPILVGLVTKVTTHPAVKGAVLLALSLITGVLSQWLDAVNSHATFGWQAAVLSALGAFAVGVASHTAILQHTPLSSTGTPFGHSPPVTVAAFASAVAAQSIPADPAPIAAQHIDEAASSAALPSLPPAATSQSPATPAAPSPPDQASAPPQPGGTE